MRVTYTTGCTRVVPPAVSEGYTMSEHAADYYPYGSILREYVTGRQEKYLSTHHERDTETGLDYRGARFYDSDVARFLSLDPLAADYASWSAYNYVMGNPISLIDPDGRSVDGYLDHCGNYLGDDGSTTSHETRVTTKEEWEATKSNSDHFTDGQFTDAGRTHLQSALKLEQWHHSINISPCTWSQLVAHGGRQLVPYLDNRSSHTAYFKPGVDTPDQSIKDHLAYPVQPGHQIYAGIDGFATYRESSAVPGAGNEQAWKVRDRGRAILTDSGVQQSGNMSRVDLAWLADKQAGYFGFK